MKFVHHIAGRAYVQTAIRNPYVCYELVVSRQEDVSTHRHCLTDERTVCIVWQTPDVAMGFEVHPFGGSILDPVAKLKRKALR